MKTNSRQPVWSIVVAAAAGLAIVARREGDSDVAGFITLVLSARTRRVPAGGD